VGETKAHGVEVLGKNVGDERREVLADGAEDVGGGASDNEEPKKKKKKTSKA